MTCIVAVTDGETVVLGGDSAATGGGELRLRADRKVFHVGRYGIGFTTSFRMGQILRYGTELPEPPEGVDGETLERFMITEFVAAVRKAFARHGFAKTVRRASKEANMTEEGQEVGGLFLVGVDGRIFEVREDYQVARPAASYAAIGFGGQVAQGALYVLCSSWTPQVFSLRHRATIALQAAETHGAGVRAPFRFVEITPPGAPSAITDGSAGHPAAAGKLP